MKTYNNDALSIIILNQFVESISEFEMGLHHGIDSSMLSIDDIFLFQYNKLYSFTI